MAIKHFDGKVTHAGRVVATRHANLASDSDFYAIVATDTGAFEEVLFDTTRFAGGGSADIDAAPDVMAAWNAHLAAKRDAEYAAKVRREAATLRKGVAVRVVKGRKVPIGTEGTVGWLGWQTYGYRQTLRVGIRVEGEEKLIFTAATNLAVVTAEYGDLEPSNV